MSGQNWTKYVHLIFIHSFMKVFFKVAKWWLSEQNWTIIFCIFLNLPPIYVYKSHPSARFSSKLLKSSHHWGLPLSKTTPGRSFACKTTLQRVYVENSRHGEGLTFKRSLSKVLVWNYPWEGFHFSNHPNWHMISF